MRHRAKILSHEVQQKLRKKKEDDAIAGIKKKGMHKLVVAHDLRKRNDDAMKKIFPTEVTPLEDLTIQRFKPPTVKQLMAFIHIRLFDTAIIPNGQDSRIPKNKGNIEEVDRGVKNLISMAYEVRSKPISMSCD